MSNKSSKFYYLMKYKKQKRYTHNTSTKCQYILANLRPKKLPELYFPFNWFTKTISNTIKPPKMCSKCVTAITYINVVDIVDAGPVK